MKNLDLIKISQAIMVVNSFHNSIRERMEPQEVSLKGPFLIEANTYPPFFMKDPLNWKESWWYNEDHIQVIVKTEVLGMTKIENHLRDKCGFKTIYRGNGSTYGKGIYIKIPITKEDPFEKELEKVMKDL